MTGASDRRALRHVLCMQAAAAVFVACTSIILRRYHSAPALLVQTCMIHDELQANVWQCTATAYVGGEAVAPSRATPLLDARKSLCGPPAHCTTGHQHPARGLSLLRNATDSPVPAAQSQQPSPSSPVPVPAAQSQQPSRSSPVPAAALKRRQKYLNGSTKKPAAAALPDCSHQATCSTSQPTHGPG